MSMLNPADMLALSRTLGGQIADMAPALQAQQLAQQQAAQQAVQAGQAQDLAQAQAQGQPQPQIQPQEQPQVSAQSGVGNPQAIQPQSGSSVSGGMSQAPEQPSGFRPELITGNGLEGQELKDWQNRMAIVAALSTLGSSIGGPDTFGGRLGAGVKEFSQGAIAGQNAKQGEKATSQLIKGSASATNGIGPITQPSKKESKFPDTSGYGKPINQELATSLLGYLNL